MQDIKLKYKELVETIAEYESDTFSASGFELKKSEAKELASILICSVIQSLIDTETMDGILLDETLFAIRNNI